MGVATSWRIRIRRRYSDFGAADIARVATDNGLLLHRYEVGFHEQNQAMVRAYPLYETTDYADNSWYTWESPTTGMTILMNNPHTGDNTACTLAGFARDPETDDTYGITAGHCAEQGHTEVYWRPATSDQLEKLGTVALWQTPGRPTPDSPFPLRHRRGAHSPQRSGEPPHRQRLPSHRCACSRGPRPRSAGMQDGPPHGDNLRFRHRGQGFLRPRPPLYPAR